MPRFPVVATIIVTLAIAIMVSLGVWQLQRRDQKEALIALFAANMGKPAMAFPAMGPVPANAMFRQSSAQCLNVIRWQSGSGRDALGKPGILYIAECRTGAEGPGFLAAMGVADRPNLQPAWTGGIVRGMIVTEPNRNSLIARSIGITPVLNPMLVAETPPPGMRAPAKPSPEDVPNNHLSYAVQWFLFAIAAAVIFLLALRKRQAKM
jgi:surfeit locus 1 family protein